MDNRVLPNIVELEPQIAVHNFDDSIFGNKVFFHVIKLKDSFHICVGTSAVMKNVAVAMQTQYVSIFKIKISTPNNTINGHYWKILKQLISLVSYVHSSAVHTYTQNDKHTHLT
jgi:hypothetical protein